MQISKPVEPITADDHAIRAALEAAYVPPLLPAIAHITGDYALLRNELKPDPALIRDLQGGMTEAQQSQARDLAHRALAAYRDAGCPEPKTPTLGELRRLMEFTIGEPVADDYLPMLEEELGVSGLDSRGPGWHKDDVAPDMPWKVVVVGAGMSGLLAAHRLQQAGIDHVVIEKNADVGGTWLENTYPGCRVDVSNHLYSYSFAQNDDWPQHFSTQPVLLNYFRACTEEFGLRERIRFNTEVLACDYDDERAAWKVRVRNSTGDSTADSAEEVIEANAVISAVGQLNRPKYPSIPGLDSFAGTAFHSARWDHSVDLKGKRVAVIGTGASAAQFIPIVALQAESLVVLQRTPNWLAPTPEYHDGIDDGLRWLYRHVPRYAEWYRLWLFWRSAEGLLPHVAVDPAWPVSEQSVSALNDELRALLTMYIEAQLPSDPALAKAITPHYPPGAKRVVRDNGVWIATLQRPNVNLETGAITSITPTGIVMADGTVHDVDVIIYGTGFQASKFLTPMTVQGRAGADLHTQWDGNARAYLGITIPHFPNFFCLYGPNTNIVVNGSIVYFSECEVRYALECLRMLLESGHRALDCRTEVHDAYNARIDEGNRCMAWGVSGVNSWYKSESGRVAQNWPFTLLDYWQQTRTAEAADYEWL